MARGKRRSWKLKRLKTRTQNDLQALQQGQSFTGQESKAWYDKHYKLLLLIPFLILLGSVLILLHHKSTTGSFLELGIQLKGGSSLIVKPLQDSSITALKLETDLQKAFPDQDFIVRKLSKTTGSELSVETTAINSDLVNVKQFLTSKGFKILSSNTISPSLGTGFAKQAVKAVIIAFLLMAIVVFFYFRVLVPSLAVVLAAFSDIVTTLALTTIFDIKINTASVAAVLMLIGYSVDTDILLSTRILKEKHLSVNKRILTALKTGLTMSFTTIAAVIVALIATTSPVIKDVMSVLLIGLIVDLINTWIQNAGILKWYVESKKVRG